MAATSSRQLKNVCVLSRFHYGKYKDFVQATIDLGRVLIERKIHPVYGGGDRWLSRLVSQATFIGGSQVIAKKLFICASTANELLDLLEAYKPEPYPKTLTLDWSTNHGSGNSKKHKLHLSLRL
ncbi:hypothetical protein WN943_019145 [Citrus x changshan-huyou]